MESKWTLCGLCGVHVEFMWSPSELYVDSMWTLCGLCGLHVDSMWTLCGMWLSVKYSNNDDFYQGYSGIGGKVL